MQLVIMPAQTLQGRGSKETGWVLRTVCQSTGIASLLLVTNYGQFLGGGGEARMHAPFPLTAICMAQVTDLLLVATVIFCGLAVLRVAQFYRAGRLVLAMTVPFCVLGRSRTLLTEEMYWSMLAICGVWAVVLLGLHLKAPARCRQLVEAEGTLCSFFVVFAAVSVAQLVWTAAWRPEPHQIAAAWSNGSQPKREHVRVVWIVLDELSYAQVYEKRAQALKLPHFDELAAQSTVFSNVQPAGSKTEKIVPALLSGRAVDGVRYSFGNGFAVHDPETDAWRGLNGAGTVFGDAKRGGWRTAAVGWYNPYCSAYKDALDDCYWMDRDGFDGPMSPNLVFWRNVLTPLQNMAVGAVSSDEAEEERCNFDVEDRTLTEADLEEHVAKMLTLDQADLMFIHLAVPHSPNIWSRATRTYPQSCGSSYLDNLALADKLLGEMMSMLRTSPRWKNTTVIVQGDHSWRTEIWSGLPAWTAEDDKASGGVFDPRPAMIVHAAGQTKGAVEPSAWPELQIHGVLERVIAGAK